MPGDSCGSWLDSPRRAARTHVVAFNVAFHARHVEARRWLLSHAPGTWWDAAHMTPGRLRVGQALNDLLLNSFVFETGSLVALTALNSDDLECLYFPLQKRWDCRHVLLCSVVWGAGDWTQGFLLTGSALYQLNYIPSPAAQLWTAETAVSLLAKLGISSIPKSDYPLPPVSQVLEDTWIPRRNLPPPSPTRNTCDSSWKLQGSDGSLLPISFFLGFNFSTVTSSSSFSSSPLMTSLSFADQSKLRNCKVKTGSSWGLSLEDTDLESCGYSEKSGSGSSSGTGLLAGSEESIDRVGMCGARAPEPLDKHLEPLGNLAPDAHTQRAEKRVRIPGCTWMCFSLVS